MSLRKLTENPLSQPSSHVLFPYWREKYPNKLSCYSCILICVKQQVNLLVNVPNMNFNNWRINTQKVKPSSTTPEPENVVFHLNLGHKTYESKQNIDTDRENTLEPIEWWAHWQRGVWWFTLNCPNTQSIKINILSWMNPDMSMAAQENVTC